VSNTNSAQPEPNFDDGSQKATTPEQLAYQCGQQDMLNRLTRPRMSVYRVLCGICWAVVTVGLALAGLGAILSGSPGGAILCFVIAALSGLYDYRIWTLKTSRLWLLI
jgi:hypothetical protein